MLDDQLQLMTEDEVCQLFGINIATASNWRIKGFGPAYIKTGKTVRYLKRDVAAWIESQRIDPAERAKGAA